MQFIRSYITTWERARDFFDQFLPYSSTQHFVACFLLEYEHCPGARDGAVQPPHADCPLLPHQHQEGYQGSGGHVCGVGGGGGLHAEGEDPWSLDEEVLPLAQATRVVRERPAGSAQVPAGLVWGGTARCFLDIQLLLHTGFPHRLITVFDYSDKITVVFCIRFPSKLRQEVPNTYRSFGIWLWSTWRQRLYKTTWRWWAFACCMYAPCFKWSEHELWRVSQIIMRKSICVFNHISTNFCTVMKYSFHSPPLPQKWGKFPCCNSSCETEEFLTS